MRMGWLLLAALLTVGGACGEECLCGADGQLFVALTQVAPGGEVEVCFDGRCARGEISDVDGTADEAEVLFAELGDLERRLDAGVEVDVTVFGADGGRVRSGASVPVAAENCCGVYWTANL